jgi:hypothetical protein
MKNKVITVKVSKELNEKLLLAVEVFNVEHGCNISLSEFIRLTLNKGVK